MKPKEDKSNLPILLVFMNFVMLVVITIASKPMEKAFEAITKNHLKEAHQQICQKLQETVRIHASHYERMYVSGCAAGVRDGKKEMAKLIYGEDSPEYKKELENIRKIFKEQSSLEWDRIVNYCNDYGKGKVAEKAKQALWDDLTLRYCLSTSHER